MKKIFLLFSYGLLFIQQTFSQEYFRPFITQWKVEASDGVEISLDPEFTYNFEYTWKDHDGYVYSNDTVTVNNGVFTTTFEEPGTYQLEITGQFPHFFGYSKSKLIDVIQWGDIEWKSMNSSFKNWPGKNFSAKDIPDLRKVTNMSGMFRDAINFNDGDLNNWKVDSITQMISMFEGDTAFNQNLNSWNVSKVKNTRSMFRDAKSFNGDISSWDVSNVNEMRDMFLRASSFNQDISKWEVSNVKNLQGIFVDAKQFNADISNWNVSNATNMSFMFQRADSFNQDISKWNTKAAKTFQGLFEGAISFNEDITKWNVSNVENMKDMLKGAVVFNQDLSKWDVGKVTDMTNMLTSSGISRENYDTTLIGWADLGSLQNNVILDAPGIPFCLAENARQQIIDEYGWTINDAGLSCLSDSTDILSFGLSAQTAPAIIDAINHTIDIEVAFGTDVTSQIPSISLSSGAISFPVNGEEVNFSSTVTYTVTAENGINSQDWTVTVSEALNSDADILDFVLTQQNSSAIINEETHTVNIEVVHGTDVTNLVPIIALSSGATSTPVNGEEIDFTDEVTYTVTAEDGVAFQEWVVNVTEAPNSFADIVDFELVEQTGWSVIDPVNFTVDIEVVPGTDVSALTPTLTLSKGATSTPTSGEETDFTNVVTYTVIAENGLLSQDWVVTVREKETVGITENYNKESKIYPNPFRDIINVDSEKETGVYIISPNGTPVTKEKVGTQLKIDLSNLTSGAYIVIIRREKKVNSKTIIKE